MQIIVALLLTASVARACDKEHHYRDHDRHLQRRADTPVFPPVLIPQEQILLSSFDNTKVDEWSSYYSHTRNVAGESDAVPKWTAERWSEYGFSTNLDRYFVPLNYPVHQSLELKYSNGSTFKATLQEDVLEEDETSGVKDRVPAFHAYSSTGSVDSEYVYVGRASQEDFQRLITLGVSLQGKIALAKYGGPYRGLKVKNAQAFGMVGAILFTDPGDDKDMNATKYAAYPDGPSRNPSSIQRGSVLDIPLYPGDPTTPGYASKEGVPRTEKKTVPKIPSLPLSWKEARPLLLALNGRGVCGEKVGRPNWMGSMDGVEYCSGPSGARISMRNEMKEEMKWINNAIGVFNGIEEDEVVIVGNHHDAWMVGGAADPHSGSAIVMELARAIGALLKTGWRPKRTIVLCSWDAEEYGLMGSTEWVEDNLPWLKATAVSYLNIDVGIAGSIPDFGATPDLHSLLKSATQKVIWPHGNDKTVYDVWEEKTGEIDALGAQSDYTAFVQRGGISAIDMGTTRGPLDPIYHTHSNYDSYHWMTKFADPGFAMHKAIGQVLTLMLFHLVDDAAVPLDPNNYGVEMQAWLGDLQKSIGSANATAEVGIQDLQNAVANFVEAARLFTAARDMAVASNDVRTLKRLNRKARDFGRGFISQGGLPGREFYQHLVFAPGLDTGYRPVTFPGITEAVAAGNLGLARDFVAKTTNAVFAAANTLRA